MNYEHNHSWESDTNHSNFVESVIASDECLPWLRVET